jgi:hypothetical protein
MAASKRLVQHAPVALTAESLTVPSPALGTPVLSVGDIAKRLGKLASSESAAIERARHWTREGLLLPIDQHHAGTGKHRRYPADSEYDLAILYALANAGLPNVSLPYVQAALTQSRSALSKWRKAPGRSFFLVITHYIDQARKPTANISNSIKHDPDAALEIVINLSPLFEYVAKEKA